VAWIALAPLLFALRGASSPLRGFLLGLTCGLVYFTGTLYWITQVMVVYGGLPTIVAVLVNAALIAYLSLFPAVFGAVVARLCWASGRIALLASPFVWVATELGRTHLFTGFPWVLLGYSQVSVLPVAQFASVFGVFGLSALVASVSAAFAYVATGATSGRPSWREARVLTATLVLVVAIGLWGAMRVRGAALLAGAEPVQVGLIQGNVDQAAKWDPRRSTAIFRDYLSMTRQAIGQGAQVVIWPESATPFFFEEDRPGAEQVRAIARQAQVPILLGSDQIERGRVIKYYNAAFLVRPDGTTGGVYRKMHLVPFGEYVPLKSLFFFAGPLVEAVSDFSAGDASVLLPVRNRQVSTAICYEIVYPDLVRQSVNGGSALLTTITNDAWFGRTSAPFQHFAQASMRAIENGRYLVRSANTGISGIVDPYGRVVARTAIFEQTTVVGEARFVTGRTVYSRVGDALAYASVLATAVMLVVVRRRVE
jgi:apolipoprotein N-acyltransferase